MDLPDKDAGVFSLTSTNDHREKARQAAQNAYGMKSQLSKKSQNASNLSLRKSNSIKSKSSERSKKSIPKPNSSLRH